MPVWISILNYYLDCSISLCGYIDVFSIKGFWEIRGKISEGHGLLGAEGRLDGWPINIPADEARSPRMGHTLSQGWPECAGSSGVSLSWTAMSAYSAWEGQANTERLTLAPYHRQVCALGCVASRGLPAGKRPEVPAQRPAPCPATAPVRNEFWKKRDKDACRLTLPNLQQFNTVEIWEWQYSSWWGQTSPKSDKNGFLKKKKKQTKTNLFHILSDCSLSVSLFPLFHSGCSGLGVQMVQRGRNQQLTPPPRNVSRTDPSIHPGTILTIYLEQYCGNLAWNCFGNGAIVNASLKALLSRPEVIVRFWFDTVFPKNHWERRA